MPAPPLGIMVEVPAVAVVPELFAAAAFFSIGSNDLTQYVTASARDIAAVAGLNDAGHPAVIAPHRRVVDAGRALGLDVSLCGDMGGDPRHIPALLAAGLRSVSVAPPQVGRAKLAIAASRTHGDGRPPRRPTSDEAVARYKAILQRVIDNRPSGTRQRLAGALGKNRSFVSQITNPAYATPIPARHIETIFEICHFSPGRPPRLPRRLCRRPSAPHPAGQGHRGVRPHTIYLPDLGDDGEEPRARPHGRRLRPAPDQAGRRSPNASVQGGHHMKKLINAPTTVLAESLDGFAAAHADIVTLGEERKFVRRAAARSPARWR